MALTDIGIQAALAALFAAANTTPASYKYMCISTEVSSQTLASALTAGATITAIPLAAGATAAIPAGKVKLDWQNNDAAPEEILITSGCAAGATSLPVTSFTLVNNHSIGAKVVPVAPETDNPSASPAGAQYLTLVAGDFTGPSGSGVGNRLITVIKKFPGASTTAASYTAARLSNANPIVAGSVGATIYVPVAVINSGTDQTFTIAIKE